jgi:hypothetical protein
MILRIITSFKGVFFGDGGDGRELRLRTAMFRILSLSFIVAASIFVLSTFGFGIFTAPLVLVGLLLFFIDSLLFRSLRHTIDELSRRTFLCHSILVFLRTGMYFLVGLLFMSPWEIKEILSIDGIPFVLLYGLTFLLFLVLDFAIVLSKGSYRIVVSIVLLWVVLYWIALSPGWLFRLGLLPEKIASQIQNTSWFTPLPSPIYEKNREFEQYKIEKEAEKYPYPFRYQSLPKGSGVVFLDSKNEQIGFGFSEKGELSKGGIMVPLTFTQPLEHGEVLIAKFFIDENADMQFQEMSDLYYRTATGEVYSLIFRVVDNEVIKNEEQQEINSQLVIRDTDIVIGDPNAKVQLFIQLKISSLGGRSYNPIFYMVNLAREYVIKKQNKKFVAVFRPILSSFPKDKIVTSQLYCVADQKRFIETMEFIQVAINSEKFRGKTMVEMIGSGIDTLDIDKNQFANCLEKNVYDSVKVYSKNETPEEFSHKETYLIVNGIVSDEIVSKELIERQLQKISQ